jgi:hypothetical protein
MTPEKAWAEGTNVQLAFRIEPARTEATLLLLLKDALTYLDYNKTISSDKDILDAVAYLRQEFPAMKIEEWHIICHRLKVGEYRPGYERLKLPELVTIFQQYEGERAEVRESNWGELKKHAPDKLSDEQVNALYDRYKKKREAEQKERESQTKIERVQVDERGRWKHIPYPHDSEERDGEET